MKITRVSMMSNKLNTMELDITQKQFDTWEKGELIQNIMPDLSTVEREFLISGMNKEEQKYIFNNNSEIK